MHSIHFEFCQPLSVSDIDRQQKIIKGVTVMTGGVEAKGHKLHVDEKTIDQVVRLGKAAGKIQVKYNHRSGVEDIAGYLFNFRKVGLKAIADWQLLAEHEETAKTLEKAEKMPECFGLSAAFNGPEKGEKIGQNSYARVTSLEAVDCVPNPAANPSGLFSARQHGSRLRERLVATIGTRASCIAFREKQDLPDAVKAGVSAAISGAALGLIPAFRHGSTLKSVMKSVSTGAAVGAGLGGVGTAVGEAVLGKKTPDEGAPITKRAALGGAIVGGGLGVGAVLALRRGLKVPWLGSLSEASEKWRPASLISRTPLPAAVAIGGVGGAAIGGAHAADEGQQVDTVNDLRRQKLHREFADTRPRDATGQFVPDDAGTFLPEQAHAAYGSPAARARMKAALERNQGQAKSAKKTAVIIPVSQSTPGSGAIQYRGRSVTGLSGGRSVTGLPNGRSAAVGSSIGASASSTAGRLRAARMLFAVRHVHLHHL